MAAALLAWAWSRSRAEPPFDAGGTHALQATKPAADKRVGISPAPHDTMPSHSPSTGDVVTSASSAQADAAAMLASGDAAAWRNIERKYFNTLSPGQLWQLLSAPGVADQFESKVTRSSVATNCSVILGLISAGRALPRSATESLQTAYCAKLEQAIGKDAVFEQARQLANDHDYESHLGNGVGPKDLSPIQLADNNRLLASILSDTTDPYQASVTVSTLFDNHSPLITDDWNAIDGPATLGLGINPVARYNLEMALRISTACTLIGGCGPSNPWTLEFCSSAGIACTPGMDLQAAISYNLPPRVLQMYRQIMARLQQAMGAADG